MNHYYRCVVTMDNGDSFVASGGWGREGLIRAFDAMGEHELADHVMVQQQERTLDWVSVCEVHRHGISGQGWGVLSDMDTAGLGDRLGQSQPDHRPGEAE